MQENQEIISMVAKILQFWHGKHRKVGKTVHLSLIILSSHSVSIYQGYMLARIEESRRLVVLHQLTPAEHVTQVKLPGTSFLTPPPLDTHLLNQL